MIRVLTYGTYDLLHYGHIRLLKRARALGDYLIVAISTDKFNAIKGKKAYHNYETRKTMVESIRYVDFVIPENTWEQKREDIKNIISTSLSWVATGKVARNSNALKIFAK